MLSLEKYYIGSGDNLMQDTARTTPPHSKLIQMPHAVNRLLDVVIKRSQFVLGIFLGALYLVYLLVVGDEVEDERAGQGEADDTREWIKIHQLKKPRGTRKGSTVVY